MKKGNHGKTNMISETTFIFEIIMIVSLLAGPVFAQQVQDRAAVTINGTQVDAESLTSSQNGTVFFGSMAKGNIYRALPGEAQAELWIKASTNGLNRVLGVFADDDSNTLWVCSNPTRSSNGSSSGQTELRAFNLKTGESKGTYPFPNGGFCNDIAVADDGTVYASDTFDGQILRLPPGATDLNVWADDPQLKIIDGLALLADGDLYVNIYSTGKLLRIPVGPDGSAGPIVQIETSMSFKHPDGLRAVGPHTLLQAEGQGRITRITINGDSAKVKVLKDGLNHPTAVTRVGDNVLVLVDGKKAVVLSPEDISDGTASAFVKSTSFN